jgi:hypothetical protein
LQGLSPWILGPFGCAVTTIGCSGRMRCQSRSAQTRGLFGRETLIFLSRSLGIFFASSATHAHEAGCSGVDAFTADWHGEWAYIAPHVSLVTRVIRKIAVSKMSGLLLNPLWKSAKFWSFAFPDGRHLCDVFGSLEKLSLCTSNWDVSVRDIIGNKVVTFLALRIASSGSSALESKVGVGRCFHLLFGKPCYCSK